MSWPELLKAKDNLRNIEHQLNLMLKSHNALSKKDISKNKELILDQIDEALIIIKKEINEFEKNLKGHIKYIDAKSDFVKRHYNRNKTFKHSV